MPKLRAALRLMIVASAVMFAAVVHARQPETYAGIVKGVAVGGYDAVAYFTDKKAVKGLPKFSFSYKDVTWRFANEKNLELFKANPEAYAPQYGGYCAFAVSHNATAHGDPRYWSVVNGKLYLNFSASVKKDWEKEPAFHIERADKNWPGVLDR